MLENEAKCNNATFGTHNLLFNMCFIARKCHFFFFLLHRFFMKGYRFFMSLKLCHRFFTTEVTDSL